MYSGEKPFAEILRHVHVSEATLTTRLTEASELGFIDQSRGAWQGRTTTMYYLPSYGEAIADQLARDGVFRDYEEMFELLQRLDDGRRRLIKELHDNPADYFMFRDVHEGTFIAPEEGSEVDAVEPGATVKRRLEQTEQATLGDAFDTNENN